MIASFDFQNFTWFDVGPSVVAQISWKLAKITTFILHHRQARNSKGIVGMAKWPTMPKFGHLWPDLLPNEIVGMAMAIVAIPDSTSMIDNIWGNLWENLESLQNLGQIYELMG